jgi:hypothetical protein
MKPPLNITGIVPIADMRGDLPGEIDRLDDDYLAARTFILGQNWCAGIGDVYFGAGLGGVVSIFLVEIAPKPTAIDRWLWVIAGDIPPAYLATDVSHNPIMALENYVALMREKVSLAHAVESSEDVIQVNAAATLDSADWLEERLNYLSNDILPWLAHGVTT